MQNVLCGVDIGGTKCSFALIDSEGSILDKIYIKDHVKEDEDGMVELVVRNLQTLLRRNQLAESDIPAIGVGCAGHIRFRDGVIITTSNMDGFKNYPLREKIQSHFSVPVILDNDTNAQALGEFLFGAGPGHENMVFMTLSTGIGAGIIINRKLYRGITGTAGEIGHAIIDPNSELMCSCGNKGCLMALACGLALPHLFEQKIKEGLVTLLDLPTGFDPSGIDGQVLKRGLEIDDPVSRAVISQSGYYVGIGAYNLFQVLNPPLIVLGGGLINWGDFYLDKIRETFYGLARDMLHDPIEITVSKIIGDAGVIGAAALTIE